MRETKSQQRTAIIKTLRKSAVIAAQHAEHTDNKAARWLKFQHTLERAIAELSAAQDRGAFTQDR